MEVLFFLKLFRTLNEHLLCLARKFLAGISKLKIAVFVSKDQSKSQIFERSLFFQLLQIFERTFTVLGEKIFGRNIKIETCSLRLERSIKKSIFWKFSFQLLQNFERTITVLGKEVFGRDIKIVNCSLRLVRSNKKSIIWKISFFLKFSALWTNIYRAWRKSFGQGYQICKLYSKSSEYHVADKIFFEGFVGFLFIRTCNKTFLDLWQQSFHPGCQKDILGVYMSPLWDVGNRSDMNWREIFFEPWRKNFDLFLKTAFYVSKGTFWGKNFFWNFFFFNQFLQNFERTFTVLGGIFWAGISKLKLAVFVSKDQSKNQFFENSLFNFFRILNEQLPCLAKKFSAGISKL